MTWYNGRPLKYSVKTNGTDSQPAPVIDTVFLDDAAVVQMLNPGTLFRTMDTGSMCCMQNLSFRNELF